MLIKTPLCFVALMLTLSLGVAGCGGNGGVVEMPTDAAQIEAEGMARQAEYSKSMQEAYGKR
ncbi:MAG: hypothetical protein AAGD07_17135 [Planctomycetota bacterium]